MVLSSTDTPGIIRDIVAASFFGGENVEYP
jgi:hypothetical protein